MATPKTGRPRGRPVKDLQSDPDRYVIALALAFVSFGLNENKAFDLCTSVMFGKEGDRIGKMRKKQPKGTAALSYTLIAKPGAPATIGGRSETLKQKLKRWPKGKRESLWLKSMSLAFAVALNPSSKETAEVFIRHMALRINELELADAVIVPMMLSKFSAPDLSSQV